MIISLILSLVMGTSYPENQRPMPAEKPKELVFVKLKDECFFKFV